MIAADSTAAEAKQQSAPSDDAAEIDTDKLAADPNDDPYYRKLQREAEILAPTDSNLGTEPRRTSEDYEKALMSDKKLAKYKEAYQKRVKRLAESKDYDWLSHYRQYDDFPDRETIAKLWEQGVDAKSYWAAQRKTARDVYAYRTRNFGSSSANSRAFDWKEVGHEVKEQAKEGFGTLPPARGVGYSAQDIHSIANGIVNDDLKDEAKAELARRELEAAATKAGSGLIEMGVGGKRWYERNMPSWLGGKAGRWFTGADDFANLSDAEIDARFALDYKLGAEIPKSLEMKNFRPSFGDQSDYADVVRRAGGELPANLSGIRFGQAVDKDGKPVPLEQGADQRTSDIAAADTLMAIPPIVFDNPATRALGGNGLKFVGGTLSKAARSVPKGLAAAAKLSTKFASASARLQSAPIVAAGVDLGKKALQWVARVGDLAKEAGHELIARIPETRETTTRAIIKHTMQSVAQGASGALPLAITADEPEKALATIIGGAIIGTIEGPKAVGWELWNRSRARSYAAKMLEPLGAARRYGLGLDEAHAEAMPLLVPKEQALVNRLRGFFGNSQTSDGVPIQIYVLKSPAYREQLAKQEPQLSPGELAQKANSRGFTSADGSTIFVHANDAAEPGQVADAMHHEGGHPLAGLAELVMPKIADALKTHMAEALYEKSGQPVKEFAAFARKYGASLNQDLSLDSENRVKTRARMEQEFIAESLRSLLRRRGIGDFVAPKSIQERLKTGFEDFLHKTLGIDRPARTLAEFDWTEVPAVTRRIEELLFKIGSDVRNSAFPASTPPHGPFEPPARSTKTSPPPGRPESESTFPETPPAQQSKTPAVAIPEPRQIEGLIHNREQFGDAFSRLKPKEKMTVVGFALGKPVESIAKALGLTAKGTMIAFQVGLEKIIRSLRAASKTQGAISSETSPRVASAPVFPKTYSSRDVDSFKSRAARGNLFSPNGGGMVDPFQRIPKQARGGDFPPETLFMPESQSSFHEYEQSMGDWAAREPVPKNKKPTGNRGAPKKDERKSSAQLELKLPVPKYDRISALDAAPVFLHPAFDQLSIIERDVWYSLRVGDTRASISERLPFKGKALQEVFERAEQILRSGGALDSEGRPTAKHIQKRPWDETSFGDLVEKYYGPAPAGMDSPHGHHILYKEGLSGRQKLLVKEGQEILRRYGIDPIFGKENLCWAPMRAKGQHDIKNLRKLVESLRSGEKSGASRSEIVGKLKAFGEIAARRK